MASIGVCKLCGKNAAFIKCHVVPDSFYAPCFDPNVKKRGLMLSSEGRSEVRQTGVFDKGLVCETCERLFSPWDSYAKELLLDFDWGAEIWSDLTSLSVVKEQYDYTRLKMFFISVTWRMAATVRPEFGLVQIPQKLRILGDHLLRQDPGGPDDFGVLLSKFRGPAIQNPGLDPRCCFLNPQLTDCCGTRCVKMYLTDWCIFVNVGDAPFEGAASRNCLMRGRPLVVVLRDFGTSKELDLMKQMAGRSRTAAGGIRSA